VDDLEKAFLLFLLVAIALALAFVPGPEKRAQARHGGFECACGDFDAREISGGVGRKDAGFCAGCRVGRSCGRSYSGAFPVSRYNCIKADREEAGRDR